MNFSELKTEFFARGTDYLEEDAEGIARAERWLNQAYREIVNLNAWSFLEATVTGNAGAGFVAIADLRKVRFVTDIDGAVAGFPGRPLTRASLDDIVAEGWEASAPGTPGNYYVAEGGTQINGYPLGGTIRVDYIRRVSPMSGTDEPVFSEEYHDLIVDKAMVKAYKDSDNFDAIPALKADINERLSAMAEDYLLTSREVQFLDPTGTDG